MNDQAPPNPALLPAGLRDLLPPEASAEAPEGEPAADPDLTPAASDAAQD